MLGKHVTAVLAALILGVASAWAQNFGVPVDHYLRLTWEMERPEGSSPRITGYLYNDRGLWATNVQLLVEAVDASGRTVAKTRGYANDVSPQGRAYFEVAAPAAAATYRVSVEFFDWFKGGPSS